MDRPRPVAAVSEDLDGLVCAEDTAARPLFSAPWGGVLRQLARAASALALLGASIIPAQILASDTLGALGIPGDDPLVRSGYLPVTLFGAHPDDDEDDTAAIQRTVETALELGYATFFPSGRYLLSDTIRAMQPSVYDKAKDKARHDRTKANALIGSTLGEGPRLVLADDAQGFDDPANPKPLVWIWAQPRNDRASGKPRNLGSTDPNDEQSNISMNQVFKGIDIDLRAAGNRGAIGIRHAGSQGSTLEDVEIWANGAYAGVVNAPGQGGGSYRLKITGGDYGIWADYRSRFPIMAGVELLEQRKSALFWGGQSNLTMAGFRIVRSTVGPVITLHSGRKPIQGALTLVDGVIEVQGGTAIDNRVGNHLYLNNVSFRGADVLLKSANRAPVTPQAGWTRLIEYAFGAHKSAVVLNGQAQQAGTEVIDIAPGVAPDWAAIKARHVWAEDFPSFEQSDVANAVDFGAVPDDGQDDSEAIERAFGSHRKVFLPKGVYTVGRTLSIPRDGHLFGVAKHLSIIRADRKWRPVAGTPVVTTSADRASRASLSFLAIEAAVEQAHTALVWRAGSGSIVRDIMVDLSPGVGGKTVRKSAASRRDTYRISGGGRWYAVAAPWNKMQVISNSPVYRHLRIEGGDEPLAIYGLNLERSLSDPQSEIRNARNVKIFYLKSENLKQRPTAVMSIVDSSEITIFGYSGIANPAGNAIVKLRGSDNLLLANFTPLRPANRFALISESIDEKSAEVSGERAVVLFRRKPAP